MNEISETDATWAANFVAAGLRQINTWRGPEPTEEPARTFWHSGWNDGVSSLPYQVRQAYKEELGREAPPSIVHYVAEMARPYLTNPYPGETMAGRVGEFIRHGIDTAEKYAAHMKSK